MIKAMQTNVLPPSGESLALAKEILKKGGLVAFPTETVYGLGADARNDDAVASIFAVKGRPQDNPLIVHVYPEYDISTLVEEPKGYVKKMMQAFAPGPITFVLNSKGVVSPRVSCGLNTLAIRIPQSESALSFLRAVDMPVAAPSANKSKHTSPVTATHVYEDFQGEIPLILDGGRCAGGIESTVVDCTGEIPVILRAGIITADDIRAVVGACEHAKSGGPVRSPGTKYKHYHPHCETAMFAPEEVEKAVALATEWRKEGKTVVFLVTQATHTALTALGESEFYHLGETPKEMARNAYYYLRKAEKEYGGLIAFSLPEREEYRGVMNRLKKACSNE